MNETCIGCNLLPAICECNIVEEFMEEQVWPEDDDLYNDLIAGEFLGG